MAKIKHHELIPDPSDPFKECKLGRFTQAENLTRIVGSYKDGFVLAIDNKWGAGKTTFVQMWRQHLENEGFRTTYFNAWQNDLGNSVFPALLSELKSLDNTQEACSSFGEVLQKAAPIAKAMLPVIAKIAIERLAGKGAASELAEAFADGSGELLSNEMEDYETNQSSLKEFRIALEAFTLTHTSNGKPFIFIIDELDRCRPNYAVQVLEQIKHLFSVTGIVFVLSIDKEQLGHAVRGVYGSEKLDAPEYLRRFIDLEYSLPVPDYIQYVDYLYLYFEFHKILENAGAASEDYKFKPLNFKAFASGLFARKSSTLRFQEKIFSKLRVIASLIRLREHGYMTLYFLLLYIEQYDSELYGDLKNKRLSNQQFSDKLKSLFGNTFEKQQLDLYPQIVAFALSIYNSSDETLITNFSDNPPNEPRVNYEFESPNDLRIFKEYLKAYSRLGDNQFKRIIDVIELCHEFK